MKKDSSYRKVLKAVSDFLIVFLLVAFVITCCMMLFVSVLQSSLGLTLTEENLNTAAKITFYNVIFLSLLFTTIDRIRRRLTVELPIKRIVAAANRLAQGDFNVRIPKIKSLSDFSRFNQIIDCFNTLAEELSGTETLRTDFIANVSHEIKTPLSVMQNYARLLKDTDISDEKRQEYAREITLASKRLSSLVSNILKLNKLENQQIVLSRNEYDLGEQLCECLLSFEDVWEKKNIEIITDIADGITVNSDKEMLSLVWNNLFSNAIKFTPEGGRVEVSLNCGQTVAEVRVSDTGCGISGSVGEHIFDKFYQGDTSHSGEGNGLGLALVKRVIDITGSEISVESELGRGTVFTVKIRRA